MGGVFSAMAIIRAFRGAFYFCGDVRVLRFRMRRHLYSNVADSIYSFMSEGNKTMQAKRRKRGGEKRPAISIGHCRMVFISLDAHLPS